MKDWFEILQEEARARRGALRDDGEPLKLALARYRQQELTMPGRRVRGWYLPAASATMGALSIMAVVLIDFEGKIQRTVWEAEHAASPLASPPTFVIGDSPSIHYSSKSYNAPLRVIDTAPPADRVAKQLKRDDKRLLQPLPGTWRRVTVRRLASEIELRTRIPLVVDPQLADKRVTIFAGERTSTLQILRGVAHLYGSGWFRSEPGPPYQYHLRRFDTPETRSWLNALYQSPQRHAPGMDDIIHISAPTHIEWLEKLHQETGRTVISDDTRLETKAASKDSQTLFQALCNRAASAGQLWDSHAETITFRKASPIGDSLLPVPH
ncbi:MAG: hypothetical protein QM758_15575 [Armatimonas sp.]